MLGIVDELGLPERALRLLQAQLPELTRAAAKNIATASPAELGNLDERIAHGLKVYARYAARRQLVTNLRMRTLVRPATSFAWVAKLPCCSTAPGIWPFCRSGC